MADSYFPPFDLKDGNLREMFESEVWKNEESHEYEQWREAMIELTTKLNFDAVIDLALYLSFEANLNDKYIWRAIEAAALENLHLYSLKHACQMQWAVTQLKPKHTTSRFDNLLFQITHERIEKGLESPEDFHHIMQGHRNKKSKDIYLKLKKILIEQKDFLMTKQEGKEKEWASNMVNLMFSFASNKPNKFGVYVRYAKEEINELLAHYENDFCECVQYLDSEGITRLA